MSTRKAARQDAEKELRKRLEAIGGVGYGLPMAEAVYTPVERIGTGSLVVDRIFGGGVPRGQITEIYGAEGSGKTTLCLSIMGQCQADGGRVVFVDAEHSFDPTHAVKFGVDVDALVYAAPLEGEQALETVRAFVEAKAADLIVVDSVAALAPRAELKGEIGDAQVAALPRLMSQGMRILTGVLAESQCAVVFTNQLREKVGQLWGNPEMTPGGRALRHHAVLRAHVRRGEWIKDGDQVIGQVSRLRTEKNKGAPPFQTCEVRLLYQTGYDKVQEVLDISRERGILERAGAWYSYGERKWQGADAVLDDLRADPAFFQDLLTKCKA